MYIRKAFPAIKTKVLRIIISITLLFLLSSSAFCQAGKTIHFAGIYNADSLHSIYGAGKVFVEQYRLISLLALAYFPELKDEKIEFKLASLESTARTNVKTNTILNKERRQYIIEINNNIKNTGFLLQNVPPEAQVALIAHELAHVLDFRRRNTLQMAAWGVRYLFKRERTKIERLADETTIKRGLGLGLYQWSEFVLTTPTVNRKYLSMKKAGYFLPDEILLYFKGYTHKFRDKL